MLEGGGELSFEVPANPGKDMRISNMIAIPALIKRFSEDGGFIFKVIFNLSRRCLV